MDLELKGKTALVLGAGGGLGSAIAEALAGEGANVALADVNLEAAERTAEKVRKQGGKALTLLWDLADLNAVEVNVSRVEAELGSIDILVNNTGGPPPTTAHGQPTESWRKQFEVMVLSVVSITDRVLPGMRKQRWGRIITSTSSGVVSPIANLGLSNSLRMTLVGWSKTLAGEVGLDGITSNIILPGRIATDRIRSLDEAKAARESRPVEKVAADSVNSIPLRRYGNPREYGDVVTFLASKRASYITGSTIRVDGGLIQSV